VGLIVREVMVRGSRGRRKLQALFDTGSTKSFIRASITGCLGEPVELPEPEKYEMARGAFRTRKGSVVSIALSGRRLTGLFRVADGLTEDLIVGADFLQEWHIRLDPRRRRIILDPKALRLKAVGGR
jgi:predicted aspartyl protease